MLRVLVQPKARTLTTTGRCPSAARVEGADDNKSTPGDDLAASSSGLAANGWTQTFMPQWVRTARSRGKIESRYAVSAWIVWPG